MEKLSPAPTPSPTVVQAQASDATPDILELIRTASLATSHPLDVACNIATQLEQSPTLPTSRALRLHLDLAFFSHCQSPLPPPSGMEDRLQNILKELPSCEVALKHELYCALQACLALQQPPEGFWQEYGQALARDSHSFEELRRLRTRVANRYADPLFLCWVGRNWGPLKEIQSRLEVRKRERHTVLEGIGVLTQYAFSGDRDALALIAQQQENPKGAAHWPIRLLSVQSLRALLGSPHPEIVQQATIYLQEIEHRETHPHVREALRSDPPTWNNELSLLELPEPLQSRNEKLLLQDVAILSRLEDERLISFAQQHPCVRSLDLSPYQGITPQGLEQALRHCTALGTLALKGHPQLLLTTAPSTLKNLDLTGNHLIDLEAVALARNLPQLEELILDDCPQVKGEGFRELGVKRLSLNRTSITASNLRPLLAKGATVELSIDNCPHLDLSFLEDGPQLTRLSLAGHLLEGVSFDRHSSLVSLNLEDAKGVTDELLKTLPSTVRSLNLGGCPITDSGLEILHEATPLLEELSIDRTDACGTNLSKVEPFAHLKKLTLDGNPNCSEIVGRCPNVQELTLLSGERLNSRVITSMIKQTPALRRLTITNCPPLKEKFVQELVKNCSQLETLEVEGALAKLKELDLSGKPITDRHIPAVLAQLCQLSELDLSNCRNLTGKGLKRLIQVCPSLLDLDVQGCDGVVPDDILDLAGLSELSYPLLESLLRAFPNIGQLNLSGCTKLQDDGIAIAITKGRLVHTLDLSDCHLGRAAFKAFEEAGSLESLSLQNCGTLNASDLRNLAKNPNLRYLNIKGCGEVTRTISLHLDGCSSLRDPLLYAFTSSLSKLDDLNLRNCSHLTMEGISRALQKCPELTTLDLRDCPSIQRSALTSLLSAAPSLRQIFYRDEVITRDTPIASYTWPAVGFEHLPAHVPPPLAALYQNYHERHFGIGERSQELQRDLHCYIPLSVAEETRDPKRFEDAFEEFLQGSNPSLLLSGDSGSGKSLSLKYLEQGAWTGRHSNSNSSVLPALIPLLIDLKSVRRGEVDLPFHALKRMGYSEQQIQELKSSTQFLFLLDGYDEMGAITDTPLPELLPGWEGKALVSCRTEYLARNRDYWKDWFDLADAPKHEYSLLPFDEGQIGHYLERFVQGETTWTHEQYQRAIGEMPGLKELVTSPLLLRLVVESLPLLSKTGERIKRTDIYEKFIESWFARAKQRMRGRQGQKIPNLDEVYAFTGKLAYRMIQLGEYEVYDDDPDWQHFFSEEVQDALEFSPLRHVEDQGYQFFHKSLVEAFASTYLYRSLLMHIDRDTVSVQNRNTATILKNLSDHPLNQKRSPNGKVGQGQEALLVSEPAVLDFLIDRIQGVPHREGRLLEIVLASRNDPTISTAAANAITLLNRGRYPFSGQDLASIQVPFAALDGAVMHHANLTSSVLRGVTLTKAQLVGAVLKGADLSDVSFGQRPMLKLDHSVQSAAFSPDGSRVAIALYNANAEIWDPVNTKRLKVLRGHTKPVNSAAFSPDGRLLITASDDKTARIWDLSSGKNLLTLQGHKDHVGSAEFSPDGKVAITAGGVYDETARVWDASSGQTLLTLRGHKRCAAISPDGKAAITACGGYSAQICDLDSGKCLLSLKGHTGSVNSVAFSPDGNAVITASSDQTARVWDIVTGRSRLTLTGHTSYVESAAFSPDGKVAITASADTTARVWDLVSGKNLLTLEGHTSFVNSAAFSPDGKVAITAGSDDTARLWDLTGIKTLNPSEEHVGPVNCLTVPPKGKFAITGSSDRTARIWDLDSGKNLLILEGHGCELTSASLDPDGRVALTRDANDSARLWDLTSGREFLNFGGSTHHVTSAALSPDGNIVLTATRDDRAFVWDSSSGTRLATLEGCARRVDRAAFSPDGKVALTPSGGNTACLWDLVSGKCLCTLEGHTFSVRSTALSSDGKLALTASGDDSARIWDCASGKSLQALKGHTKSVETAAFSPDGRLALTAGYNRSARIWDCASGKSLLILQGHARYLTSAAFSPDGNAALTASSDQTARVWDSHTGKCLQVLYGHSDRVTSAAWHDLNEIVTTSADHTIAVWREYPTPKGPKWAIKWRSAPTDLMAQDCLITGAMMSDTNRLLLTQKGAIEASSWNIFSRFKRS